MAVVKREWTSLCLKANRALGAALVAHDLVTFEAQDEAMEKFINAYRAKDWLKASLLRVLLFETQSLDESALIDVQLERSGLAAINLDQYRAKTDLLLKYTPELCSITRTVPIDEVGTTTFVVSAYHLSPAVREYWEAQLPGPCVWYLSPLQAIDMHLEQAYAQAEAIESEAAAAS